MKIAVKKEYVEAYRQASWSDVKKGFLFLVKNPDILALSIFLGFFLLISFIFDADRIVEDEL